MVPSMIVVIMHRLAKGPTIMLDVSTRLRLQVPTTLKSQNDLGYWGRECKYDESQFVLIILK